MIFHIPGPPIQSEVTSGFALWDRPYSDIVLRKGRKIYIVVSKTVETVVVVVVVVVIAVIQSSAKFTQLERTWDSKFFSSLLHDDSRERQSERKQKAFLPLFFPSCPPIFSSFLPVIPSMSLLACTALFVVPQYL